MPAPKNSDHTQTKPNSFKDNLNVLVELTSPSNANNARGISRGKLLECVKIYEKLEASISNERSKLSPEDYRKLQEDLQKALTQIEYYNQMNLKQTGGTRQPTQASPSPQRLKTLLENGPQTGDDALSQKMREIHQQEMQKRAAKQPLPQKPPITRGNNQSAAISAKVQAGSKGKKYFTDLSIEEKVKEIKKMQRAKKIKDKMPTVPSHKLK